VLFAIDRAGLVGGDGPTHNGCFDLTYLRCLPGMVVMAPADENECRQMLYTGFLLDKPAAVRYPRGTGPGVEVQQEMTALPLGKGVVTRRGRRIALLAFGSMVTPSMAAAEQLDATVVNMRFIKPMDEQLVLEIARSHEFLFTVEENTILGGAGSAVNEVLAAHGAGRAAFNFGIPDRLIQHGEREDMLRDAGLTPEGIGAFVRLHVEDDQRASTAKRA
jgi:1-deoxy-D-xylulose-5-phosphate synthase